MGSHHHDKHRQHVFGLALIILAVAVLAAVLIIVNANNPAADESATKSKSAALTESAREDIGTATSVVWNGQRYRKRPNQELVLLIGYDAEGNATDKPFQGARGDFLLLVVLDHHDRAVNFLQIDRDTVARMNTYDRFGQRNGSRMYPITLSHSFRLTMAEKDANTRETVENLLHLKIDATASMGMDSIEKFNDGIGGVTVTLRDDMTGLGEKFAGYEKGAAVTLTGDMTEAYVRARKGITSGNNHNRMLRQRDYIHAFIHQVETRIKEDAGFINTLDALLRENILLTSNYGRGWIYTTLNKIYSQHYTISDPVILDKNGSEDRSPENWRLFYLNDDEAVEWTLATLYRPDN